MSENEVLKLVASNTGLPVRLVRTAVRYWASYPDEVDREIDVAEAAEEAAEAAWRRERRLLARLGLGPGQLAESVLRQLPQC